MTDTFATVTPSVVNQALEPDYIEELLRDQGLKALYWHVGDPQRVNEDDPESEIIATLSVVYSNGRRSFRSDAVLDLDLIYGLVGQDEVPPGDAQHAVNEIVAAGRPIPEGYLGEFAQDQAWATAISGWRHSDGDLLRSAATKIDSDWGDFLRTAADIVDRIEPGTSFTDPDVQLAAVAVRIAWDLL